MSDIRTGTDVLLARRAARVSQTELARRIGVDHVILSRIEWGKRPLQPHRAQDIKRALGLVGTETVSQEK